MLADNIRRFRKQNNMSQDELAEKLGVSRQSVSLWENGQTQPTIENIITLSKLFNITSDTLLGNVANEEAPRPQNIQPPLPPNNVGNAEAPQPQNVQPPLPKKKKSKAPLVIAIVLFVASLIGFGVFFFLRFDLFGGKDESRSDDTSDITSIAASSEEPSEEPSSEAPSSEAPSSEAPSSEAPSSEVAFDLFSYCRDFAIKVGTLNGDYCMYQQPATLYGGYNNEYFSISFWNDSNMVEFCLHCPLSETQSINFYLRMRGGYNGKYEYLTSRYYRSDGSSIRSATGYIDPAVFSNKYPLNCTEYQGATDGQNEFMEESRVGMCDLITCLKGFVKAENMGIDFSAFGFVNF